MKKLLLFAFVICAILSCSDGEVVIEKIEFNGFEYFRLKQGKYEGCMNLDGNVVIPLNKKYTTAFAMKVKPFYPLLYQVYKGADSGICDSLGNEIISPEREYRSSTYIQVDEYPPFFLVEDEDGRYGACDMEGKEVVPTKYSSVFYTLTGFTVLENEDSEFEFLDITLNTEGKLDPNAITREKNTESDGFVWYKVYQKGAFGAESSKKKSLIPFSRGYSDIYYFTRSDHKTGYFQCAKGDKDGICTIFGTEIIEPKYESVIYIEGKGFQVQKEESGNYVETGIMLANNGTVAPKTTKKSATSKKMTAKNSSKQKVAAEKEKKKGKWRKWLSKAGQFVGAVASVATGVPVNTSSYNNSNYGKSSSPSSSSSSSSSSSTRIPNMMGGYTDCYPQKDGTTLQVSHSPCYMCKGTGRCSLCGGRGSIVHPYLGSNVNCTGCAMSGVCKYCQGTGEQVTTAVIDSRGNGYGVDMNGNVVTTGSSGGGSSSGSSSKSSGSNSNSSNKKYIEVIEYAPNYTGKDNSEWCEICKKVAPAHSHVKKFH